MTILKELENLKIQKGDTTNNLVIQLENSERRLKWK